MNRRRWTAVAPLLLALALAAAAAGAAPLRGPLRFRVRVAPSLAPSGASGRLLVFMSAERGDPKDLGTGFVPGSTGIAGREVEFLGADHALAFDPGVSAFPEPFSHKPKGRYHFQALLDTRHTYAYHERDGGDLVSPVVTVADLDPASAEPVELVLDHRPEPWKPPANVPNVEAAELVSPALSHFWGRPIAMRAAVVLPPDYAKDSSKRYPTAYHIHGYGGDQRGAWYGARGIEREIRGGGPELVHVFLDASLPSGHHEFADSVNNGPWGRALTTEFIPYLEHRFRLVAKPYARFVTGHSSGGWSSLWLQITYPDVFGGTWSTSPDPVDFHSFTGVDVTPGSTANVYRKPDGSPRNLVREGSREIASIEQFVRQEDVEGEYGGQFRSFEWVFSPRGPGGRPMELFNRVTGEQDPAVQRAWQKYDIRAVLESHWPTLGPKLRGKLHVVCGEQDTFHLEEAVKLLATFFQRVHSDAQVELVPGRNHMDLYAPYKTFPKGLSERIHREMWEAYQRGVNGAL